MNYDGRFDKANAKRKQDAERKKMREDKACQIEDARDFEELKKVLARHARAGTL